MTYRDLTRIETVSLRDRLTRYTRFGRPVHVQRIDAGKCYEYYLPHQTVGYVLWQAGTYGSRLWRFVILKTVCRAHRNSRLQEVPGIMPGARILLDLGGTLRVRKLFHALDELASLGFDPEDVSSAYYAHLHQRITADLDCHAYSMGQHRAFLRRQDILK